MRCSALRHGGDRRPRLHFEAQRLALHLAADPSGLPLARWVLAECLEHRQAWPSLTAALLRHRGVPWGLPLAVAWQMLLRRSDWQICARWPAPRPEPETAASWRWRFNVLCEATELARRAYDRAEAFRLMAELSAWRQRPLEFELSVSESVEVDYYQTQLEANVYAAFGLTDLAAQRVEALLRLAERRRQDPEVPGDELVRDAFYVELVRSVVWHALDRHDELIANLEALRRTEEFQRFKPQQRAELELLAALSSVELDLLEGRARLPRPSPFRELLEPGSFSALPRSLQGPLLLHEAGFQLERGHPELADQQLAAWQALTRGNVPIGPETLQALALRARQAGLRLDAGDSVGVELEIAELEQQFRQLLAAWSDKSAKASANALLYFHYASTCLTEVVIARWRLQGQAGLAEGLRLGAAVQALGALSVRLGLDPAQPIDPWAQIQARPGVVLHYFRGVHRSLVVWGSSAGLDAQILTGGDALDRQRLDLEAALARLMRTNGAVGWRELERSRAELSRQLLPEQLLQRLLLAGQSGERVALVAPGALGFLPFEVLELAPGRPLGLELALEYWPSYGVEAYLGRRPGDPGRAGALLLARTAAIPAGLPSAEAFVLPSNALAPWRERVAGLVELREEAANVDTWADRARRPEVCWLVAHGAYDPRQSIAAGLILPRASGEYPLLTVESPLWSQSPGWPELRLPPMVVLAACGAWRGPQRRGDDGSESLTARCFEAGARTVLLSYHELRFSDHARLAAGLLERWTAPSEQPGRGLAHSLLAARQQAAANATDDLGRLAPLLFHAYGAESGSPRLDPRPWPFLARLSSRFETRQWVGLCLFGLAITILVWRYLPPLGRRVG